jgi:DNA-binding CsgD family transcriptional regulator
LALAPFRRRLPAAIATAHTEVRLSIAASPLGLTLARTVRGSVLDATRRSVRVRMIVADAAFDGPPEPSLVQDAAAAGVAVRTSPLLVGFALQVDLSAAFLLVARRAEAAMVAVTDRDALIALAAMFEHEWRMGIDPYRPGGLSDQPDQVDLAVLCVLATGAKDEVVARRLGLSVRTVRRRMARLQELLGAGSRFETGVRAAEQGWVAARAAAWPPAPRVESRNSLLPSAIGRC